MKYIIIIFTALFVCSCSTSPGYTGQTFVEKSPTFYMSIAPSFDKPYEYEVHEKFLMYREYSGLGGYGWGAKKLVAKSEINQEQLEAIRALTLEAVADTINSEKKRNESGEFIVVADGVTWYIQSDMGSFLSISTNYPESNAFGKLTELLNNILGFELSKA